MSEQNRELVSLFIAKALNQGQFSAVDEFLTPNFINHNPLPEQRPDRGGIQQLIRWLHTAFLDLQVVTQALIAEGDFVTHLGQLSGVHKGDFLGIPPTGRTIHLPWIYLFRIVDTRIAESWHSWDDRELLQSLGQTGSLEEIDSWQEPVLDAEDIQGNILAGFNKNYQTFLFLQITEIQAAKRWLSDLQPQIATLEEVVRFNQLYKAIRHRAGRGTPTVRATWINIAFTFPGLKKLTRDADQFTETAFKEGLHQRAALLGYPVDPQAESHPQNWIIGNADRLPDIVLIIASDDSAWLAEEVSKIEHQFIGVKLLLKQQGQALPYPLVGHEHFGFKDGISQPGVRGRLSDHPTDFLTPRENPANPHQGKPGQNLVWTGEFVLGYPKQDPGDMTRPGTIATAGPTWSKNGSFLVFQRYRQDVSAFDHFLQSAAAEINRIHPTANTTPEQVAAKLIGRWKSGAPILRSPDSDHPALAENSCVNNHFQYQVNSALIIAPNPGECQDNTFPLAVADQLGQICPHAAHIRKSYPRDDLQQFGNGAIVETHRIIRRGIPFGEFSANSGERGLCFLAYQTSLEKQFEFIVQAWLNNPDFLNPGDGYDPIVGQNNRVGEQRQRHFTFPIPNAQKDLEKVSIPLPTEWSIPTGGGYFFAPSIRAIGYLAACSSAESA